MSKINNNSLEPPFQAACSELKLLDYAVYGYYGQSIEDCEVHDHPTVKILLLRNKLKDLLILSADLCHVSEQLLTDLYSCLKENQNISKNNIILIASHCHSAFSMKDFKTVEFARAVAAEVTSLKNELAPVRKFRIQNAVLPEGELINRRFEYPNKELGSTCIMFNEDAEHTPQGLDVTALLHRELNKFSSTPVEAGLAEKNYVNENCDGTLTLYTLLSDQDRTLAAFFRYNTHPVINTMYYTKNIISADFPGQVNKSIRSQLDCPVLMLTGALGNCRPLVREYSFTESERVGRLMTEKVLSAGKTEFMPSQINSATRKTSVILRNNTPVNREDLQNKRKSATEKLKEITSPAAKKRVLEWVETLQFIENSLDSKSGIWSEEILRHRKINIRLQVLEFPGWKLLFLPGEPFPDLAAAIEQETAAHVVGLSNGYVGYLPDLTEFSKGGYEISDCAFDEQGLKEIIQRSCELG